MTMAMGMAMGMAMAMAMGMGMAMAMAIAMTISTIMMIMIMMMTMCMLYFVFGIFLDFLLVKGAEPDESISYISKQSICCILYLVWCISYSGLCFFTPHPSAIT